MNITFLFLYLNGKLWTKSIYEVVEGMIVGRGSKSIDQNTKNKLKNDFLLLGQ